MHQAWGLVTLGLIGVAILLGRRKGRQALAAAISDAYASGAAAARAEASARVDFGGLAVNIGNQTALSDVEPVDTVRIADGRVIERRQAPVLNAPRVDFDSIGGPTGPVALRGPADDHTPRGVVERERVTE